MADADLLQTIERIQRELDRLQNSTMGTLVRAYRDATRQFDADIDIISNKIAEGVSKAELIKTREYQRLIEGTEIALREFSAYLSVDLRTQAEAMLRRGEADAVALLNSEIGDITLNFRRVPLEAMRELGNYLDPGKPLYNRLQQLAPFTLDEITSDIFGMIGRGFNPRVIARRITNSYGIGLTNSMRMMRTVQIYSYRNASHANYAANADVVEGWTWYARLDGKTCMSCVAQHGTFHPVTETLKDHHNGRCTPIPKTILTRTPFIQAGAGQKWFEQLSDAAQQDMMGASKWQAWKDGKFDFSSLSTTHTDDVYGDMLTEASLKSLVG